MAIQNHTLRPPQAIKDALWQIRQHRDTDQDARLDFLRAEHYAQTDCLYSLDSFTRSVIEPGVICYAYTGQASGAEAAVLYFDDERGEDYDVVQNNTRFTSDELVQAVITARIEAMQRRLMKAGVMARVGEAEVSN